MAAMCMLAACAHFPHGLRCFSSHCTPCPSVFRLHRSTVLRSTASAGVKKKRNAMCCGSAHQDGDSPRFQFSISSIRNKEDGGEKNASLEQQQQQQQQKNQRHRVVAELQQFQAGKAMGGALYHGAKQVDSQLKALLFLFFAAGFSAGIAVALCAVSFKASRAKQGTIADVQAVPTVAMVAGTVFSPDQLLGHLRSEEAPTSDLKAVLADESVKLRTVAADAFLSMQDAARKDGVWLVPVSGCQHLQALVSTIQAMHLILEIWLLQKLSLNQNLIKLLHFLGFKPMLLGSILRCHSLKTTSKV
ncbi:hypothetical protein CY35_05G105800 [Sphagnum magellanicum]|nr:hypothetical protein CY35_05G105800 [Sphagnum magellanicum]